MNKLLYLITLTGLLFTASCGSDDDEPQHSSIYNRSYTLLNHVTDASTGNVLAVTKGNIKYTLDVINMTADADFAVKLDGKTETPFSFKGVKIINPSYGFYRFDNKTPASSIADFVGIVDLNEEATQFSFTSGGKYRVCSTLPEIFFINCNTVTTYSDGSSYDHKDDKPMYQFDINPENMTAKVTVMTFNDTKQYKFINNCSGNGAQVVATTDGYTITADKIITTTYYTQGTSVTNDIDAVEDDGSEANKDKPKKQYIIYNLNAKLNIFANTIEATFKLGSKIDKSFSVTVNGTVY